MVEQWYEVHGVAAQDVQGVGVGVVTVLHRNESVRGGRGNYIA